MRLIGRTSLSGSVHIQNQMKSSCREFFTLIHLEAVSADRTLDCRIMNSLVNSTAGIVTGSLGRSGSLGSWKTKEEPATNDRLRDQRLKKVARKYISARKGKIILKKVFTFYIYSSGFLMLLFFYNSTILPLPWPSERHNLCHWDSWCRLSSETSTCFLCE